MFWLALNLLLLCNEHMKYISLCEHLTEVLFLELCRLGYYEGVHLSMKTMVHTGLLKNYGMVKYSNVRIHIWKEKALI